MVDRVLDVGDIVVIKIEKNFCFVGVYWGERDDNYIY